MRVMFIMMNMARLSVGVQGLGIGERATQASIRYANERLQGQLPGGPKGKSVAIVDHPDVRRTLFTMRAYSEAMRALLYEAVAAYDLSRYANDAEQREAARELCELLTPVAKAWATDLGVELASHAVQVHGGMGYVEETGVAQLLRDSRIAPIYEGTNGIQAMDLVGRKVPMRMGGVVTDLIARMRDLDKDLDAAGELLVTVRAGLAAGVDDLEAATSWIFEQAGEPLEVLAIATPYLRLFGTVAGGWMLARSGAGRAGVEGLRRRCRVLRRQGPHGDVLLRADRPPDEGAPPADHERWVDRDGGRSLRLTASPTGFLVRHTVTSCNNVGSSAYSSASHSVGEQPQKSWKSRIMCAWSAYPHSAATVARSPRRCGRLRRARSKRMTRPTTFGGRPNSSRNLAERWRRLHPVSVASSLTVIAPPVLCNKVHARSNSGATAPCRPPAPSISRRARERSSSSKRSAHPVASATRSHNSNACGPRTVSSSTAPRGSAPAGSPNSARAASGERSS